MQLKVWVESDMFEALLENQAAKLATEMWRVAYALRNAHNPPQSLFGKAKHNGDGMRRATGPDSFEALIEAARRAKEAPTQE